VPTDIVAAEHGLDSFLGGLSGRTYLGVRLLGDP
jgi:hypothetical protein